MDEVLARADALAEAIRTSERFVELRRVEAEVGADPEARKLLADLQAARAAIAEKEANGKPIEPEEKRRLAALEAAWGESETVVRLQGVQRAFLEMMEQVNRRIQGALHGEADASAE